MEKGLKCYCCRNPSGCVCCQPGTPLNLDAALEELDLLSSGSTTHNEQENLSRESRRVCNDSRAWIEQSPPLWITSPLPNVGYSLHSGHSLRVDTEFTKTKDIPQQPPNSPVSPQFPVAEQFRSSREHATEPLPQRYEWDSRLTSQRRIGFKSCQRMLSAPNISDCPAKIDRHRERSGWRPYRIPRPKLLQGAPCSRVRTISATLHEESERIVATTETSQLASAADALRAMVIDGQECRAKYQDHLECGVTFPRSRSLENLERQAMDVASTALDSVSDKIEKLHVA